MKHKVSGQKFSRSVGARTALLRSLLRALFLHGQIKTTKAKAKATARLADRIIVLAKKETLAARRQVHKILTKRELVNLLFDELAPKFKDRSFGFTRIISLGPRKGDDAPMVKLELISKPKPKQKTKNKKQKT